MFRITCAFVVATLSVFLFFLLIPANPTHTLASSPGFNPFPTIAFYQMTCHVQEIIPDLRGNFWEWQLPTFPFDYSLMYVSDGPCTLLNNSQCTVLGPRPEFVDDRMCLRTGYSWRHFVEHNSDKRWYFKFGHDTLVNLTALADFLLEQEARGDPMTQILMAYNVHEYDGFLYPQGGGSWLFSNFAVRQLVKEIEHWDTLCDGMAGDDVALTPFFRDLKIDLSAHISPRMIVRWPLVPWNASSWSICPKTYQVIGKTRRVLPSAVHRAVGIHMHHVPMDVAWEWVRGTAERAGVYFADPNAVQFCNME
jgi:hypothetical protein